MGQNARVIREPLDPRWPRLLSLTVHELRTPITVVAGYIRMLLKETAGPVSDQQRRLLEEAQKSCARLSELVAQIGELSNLEAGTAALTMSPADVNTLVEQAIASLPALPDRDVRIEFQAGPPATVRVDALRMRSAFAAILSALRREVIASDRLLVRTATIEAHGTPIILVAIGESGEIDAIAEADPAARSRFDEWRGGSGLSLAIARRIIGQHGGGVFSPPGDGKAGALVTFPTE